MPHQRPHLTLIRRVLDGIGNLLLSTFYYSICRVTAKKIKNREGYLVRENVKSLSNSVIKFCD